MPTRPTATCICRSRASCRPSPAGRSSRDRRRRRPTAPTPAHSCPIRTGKDACPSWRYAISPLKSSASVPHTPARATSTTTSPGRRHRRLHVLDARRSPGPVMTNARIAAQPAGGDSPREATAELDRPAHVPRVVLRIRGQELVAPVRPRHRRLPGPKLRLGDPAEVRAPLVDGERGGLGGGGIEAPLADHHRHVPGRLADGRANRSATWAR